MNSAAAPRGGEHVGLLRRCAAREQCLPKRGFGQPSRVPVKPLDVLDGDVARNLGRSLALIPEVDIAVDPLEGTNLCATGSANAIAAMACSEKGGLLRAPDIYMQKLIVGPAAKGSVDLDAPVKDNLKAIARRLSRDIEDLVVIVLDRPRHQKLINDIRAAGARIRLASESAVVEGNARLTAAEIGDIEAAVMWQDGSFVGLKFTAVKTRATGMPTGVGKTDATRR